MVVLEQHREAQEFERRSGASAYHDQNLVFCHPDGTSHHPDAITSEFRRLVGRSSLKRIRFHDMRHTHATLLLEAGIDITVVSKRLGHASVKTTADLYVHVTERLQSGAAERFNTYISAQDPGHLMTAGDRAEWE
jgi:integrase